ncbi:MAG: DUF1508 domain-containing protein [Acidobacteria bacterium]|nr:DUF1508 domain-containing protein [Acidobacteriota bacterium]
MYFEIYQDHANEYRWRLKAANHEPLADSGEGYTAKINCQRAIRKLKADIANAPVKDLTLPPPIPIRRRPLPSK